MKFQVNTFVLLTLLLVKPAWPQSETGTVIFFKWDNGEITMSADSKAIPVNGGKAHTQCKIVAFGDKFAFQIAGLMDNDVPGGFDLRSIAKKIWESDSLHETDADKLVQTVSDRWIRETKPIYGAPDYLRHKRRNQPDSPVLGNVVFAATDKAGKLSARAINIVFDVQAFDSKGEVRLTYPSEFEYPRKWITAGSSGVIMEYMNRSTKRAKDFMDKWHSEHAKLNPSVRQSDLAREMIALSLQLQPDRDKLGPPIEVVKIEPFKGISWIDKGNHCDVKSRTKSH